MAVPAPRAHPPATPHAAAALQSVAATTTQRRRVQRGGARTGSRSVSQPASQSRSAAPAPPHTARRFITWRAREAGRGRRTGASTPGVLGGGGGSCSAVTSARASARPDAASEVSSNSITSAFGAPPLPPPPRRRRRGRPAGRVVRRCRMSSGAGASMVRSHRAGCDRRTPSAPTPASHAAASTQAPEVSGAALAPRERTTIRPPARRADTPAPERFHATVR
eukprot:COSAG01_NODE_10447_length_2163_cov_9.567829_2_plen_222_part_00